MIICRSALVYSGIVFIAWTMTSCDAVKSSATFIQDYLALYYQSLRLGELDSADIPRTPVEYVGEIGLELHGTLEIPLNEGTPSIGDVLWIGVTPEKTLLLTDISARQAYEFSLHDGHHIRSFGRRGNGPGEYISADNMAIDPEGRIYLFDTSGATVLRYDRKGHYLDETRFIGDRVLAGRNGELFFLGVNARKIIELQHREPANWEVMSRSPLSTEKQNFISYRMSSQSELCYSTSSHRLYYLGVNDYMVKEIDASTSEVTRQFGRIPEGFKVLPERYHNIGRGTLEDMRNVFWEMSYLESMTLVQDRYLLISYTIDRRSVPISWMVYDVRSEEVIRSYVFNEEGKEYLNFFVGYGKPIAAYQDRIYMWRPPSPETVETSNGTVEIYTLAFDKKLK